MSRKSGSGVGYGHRKMVVESLERRSMLAGDVFVSVVAGSLIVRGDNLDNAIVIQDLGDGHYAVTGLDFSESPDLADKGFDEGPTTIHGNGEEGDVLVFSKVTNDINVDLKKGNDLLGIGNSPEDLDALALECFGFGFGLASSSNGEGGGNGECTSSIGCEAIVEAELIEEVEGQFHVPRNLIVLGGDGDDYIAVNADVGSPNKGGVVVINTGNGDDGVAFGSPIFFGDRVDEEILPQQVDVEGVHVEDDLIILTGSGDDNVCVVQTEVDDVLTIQTGAGDDFADAFVFSAKHVVITTDGGDDQLFVDEFEADWVTVNTGSGNDGTFTDTDGEEEFTVINPIFIGFGHIKNQLTLVTGTGNDYLEVEFISAHDIVINTGTGNDGSLEHPLVIHNVDVARNLTLATSTGHDYAYLFSVDRGGSDGGGDGESSVGNNVVIDMGPDNDGVQITDYDIGRDLTVVLGSGSNFAAIGIAAEFGGIDEGELNVGRNLTVVGGASNDFVGMGNLDVHNDLFAVLGSGHDDLFLNFVNVGRNAVINAGAGDDQVEIENTDVGGTATILMGTGNDTLCIFTSTAGKLFARGGSGFDSFHNDLGITKNGKANGDDVKEFEDFSDICHDEEEEEEYDE